LFWGHCACLAHSFDRYIRRVILKTHYQSISDYYTRLVKQHGIAPRSLDWGSKTSQELRFNIMSQVANLEGKKILDVGCGLGDFWEYLQAQKIQVDYTGYDITSAMVEKASARFPQLTIECKNILEDKVEEKFDYVFASGILYLLKNNQATISMKLISRMFKLSIKGLAFNSLSTWTENQEDNEYYINPAEILNYARQLTPWVCIRHDYLPNDFTMFLYKEK